MPAAVRRAACCVTGQVRSYHLSRLNWQHGPEVAWMLGGAERVDWYLVTSNTTSYRWYKQHVAPEAGGFDEEVLATGCQRYVRARGNSSAWTWRDAGDALEFNLDRYPYIHGNLHGTLLVQHWQLWQCRDMILRRERREGFEYDRVVRLRTDVVFGGSGRGLREDGRGGFGAGKDGSWAPVVPAAWREQPQRTAWALVNDYFSAGSRAVMLEVVLAGLSLLTRVRFLQGLQVAWHELRLIGHKRFNGTAKFLSCSDAQGCLVDLARSVGPPRSLFFLLDYERKAAEACLAKRVPAGECWRQFGEVWRLQPMQEHGLGFSYDWPPATCSPPRNGTAEHCIKMAHVSTFSATHLVGDPTHWRGHHVATPGYAWATSGACAARDGW